MGFDEVIFDAFLILIGKAPFLFGLLGAAPLLWIAAGAVLHALSTRKHTVLNELSTLGAPRPGGTIRGAAVVAGGGGAGMLAARVLSDHFEEVVVIEPNDPNALRATLREAGYTAPITLSVLRRLFPALDAALARAGLRIGPFSPSLTLSGRELHAPDYLLPPTIHGSQAGLEAVVRDLTLKERANVKVIQGRVTALAPDPTRTRIASATLATPQGASSQLPLALFVDATGAAASGAQWLAAAAPAWQVSQEAYDPRVISVRTEVPVPAAAAGLVGDDVGVVRQASRAGRYYSIVKLEDGTLRLTASQRGGAPAALPNSLTSFLTWCTTVGGTSTSSSGAASTAALLTALQAASAAEPAWAPAPADGGASIVRYDAAPGALPANFVALGSALARPSGALSARGAGAGAAVHAAALDGALRAAVRAPDGGLPDNFTHAAAGALLSRTRPAWNLAKAIDYAFEETQPADGESRRDGAWLRWYATALANAAATDDKAAARVWGVLGGTAPLSAALHPVLVAKAVWGAVGGADGKWRA